MDAAPRPEDQIATLKAILSTLDRTRASLPSLLSSFALPTSSGAERASIYRERSNEAWASIKALHDELDAAQPILDACADSERLDGVGIVVREREVRGGAAWARLRDVLGSKNAKGKDRALEGYVSQYPPPATPEQLVDLVRRWSEAHPRVTVELRPEGGVEQWEMKVVLKGVLRASCMLHWSDAGTGERAVLVERVAVFGLKEEVRFVRAVSFSV